MPLLSERIEHPKLGWISVSAAAALCLLLAGCGSSNSNPSPPPPPAPIGHAYVTTLNNLLGYAIAGSNGGFTAVATPATAPGGTAIASNGNFLYTLTSAGNISGYTINHSDGSLTSISGSPFGGAGVGVAFLTVDAAGKYLFVPAVQDFVVVPYTINSVGALTIGLQVGTPAVPVTVTVDPQAHFLYVPMGSAGTQLFQIVSGTLVSLMTIPPLGQGKAFYVAITPADTFAYISDGVSGVAAYSINASTGVLTPLAGAPFPAGTGPAALAMTPNGKFLYVANGAGVVSFAINADGSLTSIGSPITLATAPTAMSIDSTGAYLYVLSVNTTLVSVYHIDASTGVLSAQPPVSIPVVPTGIVTTP